MSNPTLPLNATPGASGNKRGRPKGSSKKPASRTASAKKNQITVGCSSTRLFLLLLILILPCTKRRVRKCAKNSLNTLCPYTKIATRTRGWILIVVRRWRLFPAKTTINKCVCSENNTWLFWNDRYGSGRCSKSERCQSVVQKKYPSCYHSSSNPSGEIQRACRELQRGGLQMADQRREGSRPHYLHYWSERSTKKRISYRSRSFVQDICTLLSKRIWFRSM